PPPLTCASGLLGPPFFQRYGVNLPSSLTEGRSFTLGAFPLPTGVGLRYGQSLVWLAAFLGGLGAEDFRRRKTTRCQGQRAREWDLPHSPPSLGTPLLSNWEGPLPYRVPASLMSDLLWCRNFRPAFHRLRLNVLGLGPDSPW